MEGECPVSAHRYPNKRPVADKVVYVRLRDIIIDAYLYAMLTVDCSILYRTTHTSRFGVLYIHTHTKHGWPPAASVRPHGEEENPLIRRLVPHSRPLEERCDPGNRFANVVRSAASLRVSFQP